MVPNALVYLGLSFSLFRHTLAFQRGGGVVHETVDTAGTSLIGWGGGEVQEYAYP